MRRGPDPWSGTPVLIGLALDRSDAGTAAFARDYRRALESPAAAYLGSRSYSVYLCHLPIIAVCHSLWLDLFPTALQAATFLGVAAMAVPLTLIAADLLYRGIERPEASRCFGSRLARRTPKAVAATALSSARERVRS